MREVRYCEVAHFSHFHTLFCVLRAARSGLSRSLLHVRAIFSSCFAPRRARFRIYPGRPRANFAMSEDTKPIKNRKTPIHHATHTRTRNSRNAPNAPARARSSRSSRNTGRSHTHVRIHSQRTHRHTRRNTHRRHLPFTRPTQLLGLINQTNQKQQKHNTTT